MTIFKATTMKFPQLAALVVAVHLGAGGYATAAGPGDLYILTVGVEPELTAKGERDPYALDAVFVRQALVRAETQYKTTHSQVLSGKQATRANVLEALNWLGTSVGEGDVAIVFFSTHGDVDSKKGYRIDLLGSAEAERHAVLWGSELNTALTKVRGRTILLLDTCCAAAVLSAGGGKAPRAALVAACKAEEGSDGQWKRTDRPHGWFVIALCEALGGRADTNQDGIVTLGELNSYLPDRAKQFYREQNAVVSHEKELLELTLARIDRNNPAVTLWPPEPREHAAPPRKGKPEQ